MNFHGQFGGESSGEGRGCIRSTREGGGATAATRGRVIEALFPGYARGKREAEVGDGHELERSRTAGVVRGTAAVVPRPSEAIIRLTALRYALALATMMSVEAARPT